MMRSLIRRVDVNTFPTIKWQVFNFYDIYLIIVMIIHEADKDIKISTTNRAAIQHNTETMKEVTSYY